MRWTLVLVAALITSCVVTKLEVTPLDGHDATPIAVQSPVKAHLHDGSTIVYPEGISVEDGQIIGEGWKYDITLETGTRITRQALDAVAAMESYQTPTLKAASTAGTVVGVTAGAVGAAILAVAIFGSCPTIYTLESGSVLLEAESFSYSIAPGLESMDVDRLGIRDAKEEIRLELRNEALETHYINQLTLLDVVHPAGTAVYPDLDGRLVVVRGIRSPERAHDRSGHDISRLISSTDGIPWRADDETLRTASANDFEDYVELEFDVAPGVREAALVFRLRNSLLNTTLLYEVLLGRHGLRALDWMGTADSPMLNVERLRIAHWYGKRMGMRIEVWDGERYRESGHFMDQGPIAWKELAILVPVATDRRLKVRLSSVVDNWRIDSVGLADAAWYAESSSIRTVHASSDDRDGTQDWRLAIESRDDRYLVTEPGYSRELLFRLNDIPANSERTLLVAATGYYVEWIRSEWLQQSNATPFASTDDPLVEAIALWRTRRDSFRDLFEQMRVETR